MAKKVKAGDVLVWTHYSEPGTGWQSPFERIGTVFADAPTGNSLSSAWWVQPDEPLDGEVLAWGVIAVGKAAGRHWLTDGPAKGEVYSSSFWRHQPAALTAAATRAQRELHEAREHRGYVLAA